MKYIISLSGGINSLNCLDYCIKKFHKKNIICIFADTNIEHKSLYEGLDWIENHYQLKIIKLKNLKYKDPWDVAKKRKVIWGTSALCTHELKINIIQKYILSNFIKGHYKVVIGYNTNESKRIIKAKEKSSYDLYFPVLEKDWISLSYKDWKFLYNYPTQWVYEKGGRSNNCGGGCFKMAQYGWFLLWKNDLPTFLIWEQKENEIRTNIIHFRNKKYGLKWMHTFKTLPKDLNILRKKSLRDLRLEWEQGKVPKKGKRNENTMCKSMLNNECNFNV